MSTGDRMSDLQGVYENMPETEYHSRPELSSTQARLLLKAPAFYKDSLEHPQPHKDAFDLGTAVHTKVLGTGSETVVLDFPDYRTKAAREARDEARAAGLVVISPVQAAQVGGMAESLLADPEARAILEGIDGREVSVFAEVDGVPQRARFDIYGTTKAGDLKSARDASPKGFNQSVGRYGYHIQEQWYREVHKAVAGAELESFKFLVVENVAPYLVGVYDLDFMWEDIAKERTKRARELYLHGIETDTWPGYVSGTLTPPTWAVYENEEEEIAV